MDVERIVLLDAAAWVHVNLRFDRRKVTAATGTASPTGATGATRASWSDRRPTGPERHASGRWRRWRPHLVADGSHDRAHRVALAIHLQRRAVADEEHAPVLDRIVRVRFTVGERHEEVVVEPRDRIRVRDLFRIRVG